MSAMWSATSWCSRSSRRTTHSRRMAKSRAGRAFVARRPNRKGPPQGRLVVDVVTTGALRAPALAAWLWSIAPARARGHMTVALVPDARVRALNRQYRKKDKPTDVLSFPADERGYLGDA